MPKPTRAGMLLVGFCALAGCVDDMPRARTGSAKTPVDTGGPQPRTATYNCGNGTLLKVENSSSQVVLTADDGEPVTLPAAPQNQRSRYGAEGYALVLDGPEALYMKGGKEPQNCRR